MSICNYDLIVIRSKLHCRDEITGRGCRELFCFEWAWEIKYLMMTFGQKNQKSFIFSSPLLTPWSLMVLLRISVVRFWNLCFAGFSSLCHFWCGGSSGSRAVAVAVGADHMGSIPRETGSPRTSKSLLLAKSLLFPYILVASPPIPGCVSLPLKRKRGWKKGKKALKAWIYLSFHCPLFLSKRAYVHSKWQLLESNWNHLYSSRLIAWSQW